VVVELADVARQSLKELGQEAPSPITKQDAMKAFRRAKRWMSLRTGVLAVVISATVTAFLACAGIAWSW